MAIPGVTTIIKDRFYTVSRQDAPVGPRIVAIAKRSTATNTGGIADLDVVRATNEADVITAFGSGSDLHRAFLELVIAGAERVFLVPLPSDTSFTHASGTVTSTSAGGDVFNAAFAAAEAAIPDIIIPWGRGGHPYEWENPATPANDNVELGFHADNTATVANNWAYKVALATKSIAENTNPCMAVMGIKPYINVANISDRMTPSQVSTHLSAASLPLRDTNSLWATVGPYITVVASEVRPVNYFNGTFDFGYTNGAAFLAATMSRLPSYSSIVNKPLYNVDQIRYVPTRAQQTDLSNKGVNSVIVNFNKIPVFGEGLTFGQSTSDYTRLSTKRIVDEATLVVRQQCQKYIGQPSTIEIRNSMETAITSGLRGMQLLGALLGSDFNVTYIPSQNKAIIDLVLTPAFELKTIEVQVAITL
jgi:hypothetical protein